MTSGREDGIVDWKRAQWVFLVADVAAIAAALILAKRIRDMQAQAWFWSPSWLAGEAEAQADIRAGRFERFDSSEHFLKSLGASDEELAHSVAVGA